MADFNSLNDLAKYINSPKGQNTLTNGNQVRTILMKAGRELEGYLKDELNKYFASTANTVSGQYERTGDTLKAIKVGTPINLGNGTWKLVIDFDESISSQPSRVSSSEPDGFTSSLLNTGWLSKPASGKVIPGFTNFKGTNYIDKAVQRFNKNNKYGLTVSVTHNDRDITNKTFMFGK